MAQPTQSWVAKWQRLEGYVSGVYAVKVIGVLPPEVVSMMEAEGVKYIPRDGTEVDEDR
jgi:transcription elongation factor SPT4